MIRSSHRLLFQNISSLKSIQREGIKNKYTYYKIELILSQVRLIYLKLIELYFFLEFLILTNNGRNPKMQVINRYLHEFCSQSIFVITMSDQLKTRKASDLEAAQ